MMNAGSLHPHDEMCRRSQALCTPIMNVPTVSGYMHSLSTPPTTTARPFQHFVYAKREKQCQRCTQPGLKPFFFFRSSCTRISRRFSPFVEKCPQKVGFPALVHCPFRHGAGAKALCRSSYPRASPCSDQSTSALERARGPYSDV